MRMFSIQMAEINEDDGTYLCSALIIKLLGFALVLAFGRKK